MIIGRTQSADGGFRRITIRHTHIVDDESRKQILSYIQDKIYDFCVEGEWIGSSDMYPNLPHDIIGTPLQIVYDNCRVKFKDNPDSLKINLSKYVGMLVREAVYYSKEEYYEQMMGSVRKYSLSSKNLVNYSVKTNRINIISHSLINNGK